MYKFTAINAKIYFNITYLYIRFKLNRHTWNCTFISCWNIDINEFRKFYDALIYGIHDTYNLLGQCSSIYGYVNIFIDNNFIIGFINDTWDAVCLFYCNINISYIDCGFLVYYTHDTWNRLLTGYIDINWKVVNEEFIL